MRALTETEKQEALAQEQFIAEVLRIRKEPREKLDWWKEAGIIGAIAAVATVAVTTFGTGYMQTRLKSQEVSLSRQEVGLNQTRDAMITVYDLLSALLKGTDDRAYMAAGQYDALPDTMFNRLVVESNAIDSRWRRERGMAAAGVYLYFGDHAATPEAWESTRDRMQRYANCAESAYVVAHARNIHVNACVLERVVAESSFNALRDSLIARYRAKLGP